jgi:hypothetical protein
MHETPLSGLALIWLRSKSPGGLDAQGVDTFFPGLFHGPSVDRTRTPVGLNGVVLLVNAEAIGLNDVFLVGAVVVQPRRDKDAQRAGLRKTGGIRWASCPKPKNMDSTMRSNSVWNRPGGRRIRLFPIRCGGPINLACLPTLLNQFQRMARQRPGCPFRKSVRGYLSTFPTIATIAG